MKEYENPEILKKLYWKENLTLHQIAKRLGTSLTTVFLHMKKHGIERRRCGKIYGEMKQLEPSENLAYWVGVMQTDGSLTKNGDDIFVDLGVSSKSLPMLVKFSEISKSMLERKCNIYKRKTRNLFNCRLGVKTFLKEFKRLDIKFGKPPQPPEWCRNDIKLFGAYLAGIIDGDGNVHIQLNKRKFKKPYFQCQIRIFSKFKQLDLKNSIENLLNCKSSIQLETKSSFIEGRKVEGICYRLNFLVSSKNYSIFQRTVLPELTIPHKSDPILSYLSDNEKMDAVEFPRFSS